MSLSRSPSARNGNLAPSDSDQIADAGVGMAYMSAVSLLTRFAAAGAQWVLGIVLLPTDFALYASAVSAQAVVTGLRDAGVGKYLIQRGRFDDRAYPTAVFAFLANILAIVGLFGIAPLFSKGEEQSELSTILLPLMLLLPLQSFATVLQAKVRLDQRFRRMALIETVAQFAQSGVTILLALTGVGVFSLVIGTATGVLCQLAGYRLAVGKAFSWRPWSRSDLWEIFGVCKWIMLAGGAAALALRGDYIVLGFCANKELVGYYFFGVQLVLSFTTIISSSLQTVILPTLCRSVGDAATRQATFNAVQDRILRYAVPACIGGAFIAPGAMHLLWAGKWDAAAVVVQGFLVAFLLKLPASVAGVLFEACGLWRARLLSLLAEAALMMAAATIAVAGASLGTVTVAAVLSRMGVSMFQILLSGRLCMVSTTHLWWAISWRAIAYIGPAVLVKYLIICIPGVQSPVADDDIGQGILYIIILAFTFVAVERLHRHGIVRKLASAIRSL